MLTDILFIISVFTIAWFGWKAGFVRSAFAVATGFLSFWAASAYPYQEGIKFYLVFIVTALFIFIIAALIFRLVKFLYLGVVDKTLGLALNLFVWFMVCVNVIIPTMTKDTHAPEAAQERVIFNTISDTVQKKFSIFKEYVIERRYY